MFLSCNQIITALLDINHNSYMEGTKELLLKYLYGLSLYGDVATVRRMPLLIISASGVHVHTVCLEIIHSTSHL
jgi:hypothetical protein